ncbi:MAG: IS1096 element passenger TnpR family protein [Bacteroidota bacterium]
MATYRLRVIIEDHEEVVRDIEIKSTQTFEELHHAIHTSIGFDGSKSASFYMSDDNWKKGKEITNKDLTEAETETKAKMKNARLCDFIIDPHQKIYYVFDLGVWTFRIELVKINREEDQHAKYPRCIKSSGEAPKQYGNTLAAALPIPEDFDSLEDLDDAEDDEDDSDGDILAIDSSELPEGEEKDDSFIAATGDVEESADDFGSDDENMLDDSISEDKDEF